MASGSQSVGIDSHWHWDGAPRRGVTGTLSASFNDLVISASCSVTQSQRPGYPGHSSLSDTVSLLIDGNTIDSASIPMVGTNSRNLNGSMNVGVGVHTISVQMYCPDIAAGRNCSAGLPGPIIVGSITFDVPNPEVPPTNISGGSVYNQNNIINGDDKPDWNFYVDWWGESAGTHSITKVNLDLRRSSDPNSAIVAYIDNVQKWTRYNFETLLPKCKVGETYYFFTNVLIDNSYWMGARLIGQIKLFKDGIVWVKRYDNGVKTEATMAYNKYYKDGSRKASRYILVKDYTTGAKHIIDMYTTHYE